MATMVIHSYRAHHRQSHAYYIGSKTLAFASLTPVDIGVNRANIGRQNQQAHSSLRNWSIDMSYISVKNEEYDGL